jgi:hypothetical protein
MKFANISGGMQYKNWQLSSWLGWPGWLVDRRSFFIAKESILLARQA